MNDTRLTLKSVVKHTNAVLVVFAMRFLLQLRFTGIYKTRADCMYVCVHGGRARWSFICPFPISVKLLPQLKEWSAALSTLWSQCRCRHTSSSCAWDFTSCKCRTWLCYAAATLRSKCRSSHTRACKTIFLCLRVTFTNNKAIRELKCKAYMLTLCCIAFTFPKLPPPPLAVYFPSTTPKPLTSSQKQFYCR